MQPCKMLARQLLFDRNSSEKPGCCIGIIPFTFQFVCQLKIIPQLFRILIQIVKQQRRISNIFLSRFFWIVVGKSIMVRNGKKLAVFRLRRYDQRIMNAPFKMKLRRNPCHAQRMVIMKDTA